MYDNEIRSIIERGELLPLIDNRGNEFMYFDDWRILIPLQQDYIEREYSVNTLMGSHQEVKLKNYSYTMELIREQHAQRLFAQIRQCKALASWKVTSRLWYVASTSFPSVSRRVYNCETCNIESLRSGCRGHILQVVYLPGKRILEGNHILRGILSEYGLVLADIQKTQKYVTASSNIGSPDNAAGFDESQYIQELLDCDKKRCGLASYQREMLYDIKAGHWDVFEKGSSGSAQNEGLIARDPRLDIKKNGVIGIDFGTKSTVVVKQEGSNEIRPIRIGSLSLKAEVSERDYENPTIISCMDIKHFLEDYNTKAGRPETSCNDFFVSYNAYNEYVNCPTENFYAYYSELKQWANKEKKDAVVQDTQERMKYYLSEECSIENAHINPIEIYAYYIGMYINNMRNGIYLKYIMSFPVKYSKATKELIRKSFEKGLRKSLPNSIVEDAELMTKFSVSYQISEPAAYAVTALERSGFKPKDETEKYLYGIFDFGGGTTDFDFGVWRGANDDEYDKFNCDYVLECFGADSDARLGGENILEMLAYQVFKNNKNMAAEKKIACALPADQVAFIGGEHLISNSQSANRNLTLLKEALRPLWEQHDNWEEKYYKKSTRKVKGNEDIDEKDEYVEMQMYDFNGQSVPNCRFEIDTQKLLELIKQRIQKGVDAFFKCIEKAILGNKAAQFASEKIYIFLAGNSCKSVFVEEIFRDAIREYNKEYGKFGTEEQDRFELIKPLTSIGMEDQYIPNAKTSVAYGLVKSRPGGKIYVRKNYETDSSEETKFKYYLGSERRGKFECKLAPVMEDENGENQISYNKWHKFQGAGMGTARIYYTEDPRADSRAEKLDIGSDMPYHEIQFESEEDKYVFIKAVQPSVIKYVIAGSEDEIEEGDEYFEEVDFDKI
jgi:hypothetical protein